MASENFTGERPGWGKHFDYDESRHLAAYRFAADFVKSCKVLDAGCGEGFGSQTLADTATSVLGIDYSAEAIDFSSRHWDRPNLSFLRVDLMAPGDFQETFDVVLNFQVLEHIEDEMLFLEGLKKRLTPGGKLILTTPNRLKSFSENPYHVREYTAVELSNLLSEVFSNVRLLGMHGNRKVQDFDAGREAAVKRILYLDPLNIRKLLPSALVNLAFAKLSVVVRRSARRSVGEGSIVPEDFYVDEADLDEALDLVAVCEA